MCDIYHKNCIPETRADGNVNSFRIRSETPTSWLFVVVVIIIACFHFFSFKFAENQNLEHCSTTAEFAGSVESEFNSHIDITGAGSDLSPCNEHSKNKYAFRHTKNSLVRKPTTAKAAPDNQEPVISLTQDNQTQS